MITKIKIILTKFQKFLLNIPLFLFKTNIYSDIHFSRNKIGSRVMDNHNLLRLRFTGFVLVLCLLCQSCVSMMTTIIVGDTQKKNKFSALKEKYDCSFDDILFLKDYNELQDYKFGILTGSVDTWLAYTYNIRFHPIHWSLVGNFYYGLFGFTAFLQGIFYNIGPEELSGWQDLDTNRCRQSYFIQSYKSKKELKQEEMNFYKILAHYGKDADVSHDEKRFTEFQREFLKNNNQIQVYKKHNYFYRYIYYLGGKKVFESQFKKYLYLHSN